MERRIVYYIFMCHTFSHNIYAQLIEKSGFISFANEQETATGIILIEGQ